MDFRGRNTAAAVAIGDWDGGESAAQRLEPIEALDAAAEDAGDRHEEEEGDGDPAP